MTSPPQARPSSGIKPGAEVVAKRCGHSKPANNRPFMMPCNAMMILLCPPPLPPPCTSLHSCTGMWSNKLPAPLRLLPSSQPPPPPPPPPPSLPPHTTSPVLPPSQPKPLSPQIKGKKL
ncbi:sulfated surface glycoprotein 185-like [Larimichthys crocea]|uniref:sulfated surface glycoprotein 185-like n=1 Tax=Larimichthys crocea TaxID=215358 RepID=UPI000F5E41E9|nr:sulfated surface glycoprotein 185-like [Larimichthys crocea]